MLKINNLSKKYIDKLAVDSVNIEVKPGEIFGFVGHNGAGKTTTIKCIVGILDFEDGEILIDGLNVKKDSLECKKKIAYIPDNPDVYGNLTAIGYLNFVCDVYKVSKEVRKERIEKYAKEFGIYDELSNLVSSFSHGMKQKLVIISALIHEPKLLILDEPFVGLDPIAQHKLKEIMKKMCKENNMAVFFSSHVHEVVEKLCDKVAIINKGKIEKIGLTSEITKDKSLENIFIDIVNEEN